MKKIVILGHSLSAIKAVESLKAFGEALEVVIISQENTFPYFRYLLPGLPAKKIQQNKIFYRPSADYPKEGINFIFDKKITRINFKRGRLTLDDKEHVDYNLLFLSDLSQTPFFGIKGANKTGLYNLRLLGDMTNFVKLLPLAETVIVQSDNIAGLKTALAIAEANKEVVLVTSSKLVLGNLLSETDAASVDAFVQSAGVRVLAANQITELLGDNEVKAIRLQNGKVLGCQAVLTDNDLPDLRLFKETELQCGQRVCVNQYQQTNFENVFALDAVCDTIKINDWDVSQEYALLAGLQGQMITSKITAKEYLPTSQTLTWDIEFKDQKVSLSSQPAGQEAQGNPVLTLRREEAAAQQNSCINA